ncbi:trans-aconitate 2-methyltransferase [Nocardioides marmoraquaticus]
MAVTWDPDRYLQFGDHRSRPFLDLLARVGAVEPATVVDLGCGPGTLTRLLAERWPAAQVLGVDSSPEMVARAEPTSRLAFEVGDLRDWEPDAPVDVLLTNATLQWVPDHLDLLPRLLDRVAPGGWFAMQVPGNFAAPSHALLHQLAAEAPYDAHVREVERPSSHDPATYLRTLRDLGCEVDAWETTYLHVLPAADDPDPVFGWVSGTGARPVLQALPDDLRPGFEATYRARLRAAYPERDGVVVLPFRRVFAVARRP